MKLSGLNYIKHGFMFFLIALMQLSCAKSVAAKGEEVKQSRPNIIWLVAEDMSPDIPAFGDLTIETPNLSRLADEGVRYSNVYSVSGVCSPSRAALSTGMYPSKIGAHNMRTLSQQPEALEMGLINYECVPPENVKMVSEIMRGNGYYCTNNTKEDYQFYPSKMAWDESGNTAHWKNKPKDKPFFAIFNFMITHESKIWSPFKPGLFDLGNFPPERNSDWEQQLKLDSVKPLWVSDNLDVEVPPYLPDNDVVRKDIRKKYSNIIEMDRQVGILVDQLEKSGLLENTIIVWYSDHGGPLPRQKRLLYDSGLKVPMIIRYPEKKEAGKIDEQLISFVDFAPSLLSMAGIQPPDYMDGRAFGGAFQDSEQRKYIHAAADRFDECYDMIRAVKDKRFKYLKNFQPQKPYYLPVAYRENMSTMKELLRLNKEGALNQAQKQWFRQEKPEEELFDTANDPHELVNLAMDLKYAEKLKELREECDRWMDDINDLGQKPETDLIENFWPGKNQPITSAPQIKIEDGKIHISCATKGASIGFKYLSEEKPWLGWNIYNEPISSGNKQIKVIAHRIGYMPSETVLILN